MREIRDAAGVDWLVYEVQPKESQRAGSPELPEPLRNGWLCFESAEEKRRLIPTPVNWSHLPPDQLAMLIAGASLVKKVPSPQRGS